MTNSNANKINSNLYFGYYFGFWGFYYGAGYFACENKNKQSIHMRSKNKLLESF